MPKKYRTAVRGEVSTYQGTPKKPSFAGIRSLDRALLAFCAAFRAFFASGAGVIPVTRLEDGGGLSVRVRRIHSSKWVSLEPPRRRMKEWSTVTKRFSDQVVTNSVERMRQGQGADVAAPEWQEEGRPLVRALADFKGPWGQLASNRAGPAPPPLVRLFPGPTQGFWRWQEGARGVRQRLRLPKVCQGPAHGDAARSREFRYSSEVLQRVLHGSVAAGDWQGNALKEAR